MSYSYRSRKLDLKQLESQPQKSLDTVHTILSDTIGDLESRLRQLQWSFYGRGRSVTDELHKWSTLLKRVVNLTKTNGLFSLDQMEEMSWKEADGRGAFANDLLSMHQMMECCHKTDEAVPGVQLNELVIEVRKLLGYLEKYCASFYDPDRDPVIETAGAYEKQRRRYINVVNDLISKIYQLAEKFKSKGSGEGLRMTDLSGYSVELSRRTDVAHAPFLLLFPEAVENIRLALSAMRSWVEDDRNFAAFLENDVRELDARRVDVQKQVRALSQSYHQLGFRMKQAQTESDQLGEALGKTQDREDALVVEEELLSTQVKDFETELDSTEFRKTEWNKNAATMSSDVYHDKLNEFSERIRELRGRIPPTHQQLVTIRSKLRRVESKRGELRTEEKRRKQLEVEMEEVSAHLAEAEVELDGTTVSLETARRIVLCKRSSDVVEKIFYQQQVVKPSKGKKKGSQGTGGEDIFDKACAIVANHISKDWPRLYRVLPFHPPRGLSPIDKDIYDLMTRESRGGKQHLARMAIDRWRRNHTRAKVEDLAVALGTIQRSDIVEQMNAKVHPPEPEVVVQSEIPDWVDAELVPYWREIERFDEIMANNGNRNTSRLKTRHAV